MIAKPQHQPLEATPIASRKMTQGTKCKLCRGSGVMAVLPPAIALDGSGIVVGERACAACNATGWKEPPRLYAGQRAEVETLDAFVERVRESIVADPAAFYMRETIMRPETELARMRLDLINWIALDQISRVVCGANEPPRNDDACFQFHQRCPYLAACKGEADINDPYVFPRGAAHPELAAGAI